MACGDTRLFQEGEKVAGSLLFLWDRLCQGGAPAMGDRATWEWTALRLPLRKGGLMIQRVALIATAYSVVPSATPHPSLSLQGKCPNVRLQTRHLRLGEAQ